MDRIEDRADFGSIRYSNCWEDAEILSKALTPQPGSHILSIASAGDNSLALLAEGAQVIAADLNPTQLACVEIRQQAIRHLDHRECLAFLGITPMTDRTAIYDGFKNHLSETSKRFWERQRQIISGGLIHAGKFERYFQFFRQKVLPLIHDKETIAKLLESKSREERLAFYERKWSNWRWRLLFKIFFSRPMMGRLGRDPEFFRYVEVEVSKNIMQRTRYALTELATHCNPYLDYILTGNFTHCLPYYLTPEIFRKIKKNIDNLVLVQAPIHEAAKRYGDTGFDGYNLSDIFEYLDPEASEHVYRTLLDRAKKNARFVYWNMLVPRCCPPSLADRVVSLDALARELFLQDKAFFYSNFIVEEVLCS